VHESSRARRGVALHTRATITMATVAFAVGVLPYRTWRYLLLAPPRVRRSTVDRQTVKVMDIVRATDRATRLVPRGYNCLVRALSARLLLAYYGFGSTLSLGVAKTASGALAVHAWLQRDGEVVIGGDVQGFASHCHISE
jgi:hypothetical protein